jgi:hypothetical protein
MADTNQSNMGALQIGIIILTLATAFIHVSLLFPNALFILNALGYLTLLAAYILPIGLLQDRHGLVRWAFIAFTAVTILAWVAIGDKSWPAGALGYATKVIEVLLITLLVIDGRQEQSA